MVNVAFLDDGHGMGTPGKRTPYIPSIGRQIKENEFNKAVVKQLKSILERHGIICYEVAPTDHDTPLKQRTDFANSTLASLQKKHGKNNVNAIYVSVHYDAYDSKFDAYDPEGITVFVYPGNLNMNSGKLARSVLKYLVQGTPQRNRGVKESNLHVLRETKMPAILTENGFMDNMREALLMIDSNFQTEVATEHAKGICEYFGIKYIEESGGLTVGQYKELLSKINELNDNFRTLQTKVNNKADAKSDAPVTDWAREFYNWGVENGITDGSNPRGALTRQQALTMLYRLYDKIMKEVK